MDSQCPYCGGDVLIVHSSKIYGPGHNYGLMRVCENFPDKCDAYSGIGATLANAELRELRKECHRRFDKIWQSGERSRKASYTWLGGFMKLPRTHAHIALFNREQCRKLLDKLYEIGY